MWCFRCRAACGASTGAPPATLRPGERLTLACARQTFFWTHAPKALKVWRPGRWGEGFPCAAGPCAQARQGGGGAEAASAGEGGAEAAQCWRGCCSRCTCSRQARCGCALEFAEQALQPTGSMHGPLGIAHSFCTPSSAEPARRARRRASTSRWAGRCCRTRARCRPRWAPPARRC